MHATAGIDLSEDARINRTGESFLLSHARDK